MLMSIRRSGETGASIRSCSTRYAVCRARVMRHWVHSSTSSVRSGRTSRAPAARRRCRAPRSADPRRDDVTVFHLLRHGEPSVFGRINGRLPGVGLSAKGRAEIGAVASRLAGEKIDAIYASPLQRTRETAEILSDRLALPVQYRDDVIELDFGEWTGLTADQIRKDERGQMSGDCRVMRAVCGGESGRDGVAGGVR